MKTLNKINRILAGLVILAIAVASIRVYSAYGEFKTEQQIIKREIVKNEITKDAIKLKMDTLSEMYHITKEDKIAQELSNTWDELIQVNFKLDSLYNIKK